MKKDDGIQLGAMSSDPPPLHYRESRGPMLLSIGEKLRALYAEDVCEPLPPRLEALVQELMAASRETARGPERKRPA